MSTKQLSLKQKFFIQKYLETGNLTEAAFCVYKVKKRATAAQIGYENLRKPDIKQAIETHLAHVDHAPVYIAEAFVNILKNGTPRQRLEICLTYLKIHGLT